MRLPDLFSQALSISHFFFSLYLIYNLIGYNDYLLVLSVYIKYLILRYKLNISPC